MSSVEERIRAVRKELEALQTADHPAHIEQKKQDYIEALRQERSFMKARLAEALKRGDKHERILSPYKLGEYVDGELTGTEAAERCSRSLEAIDAELERVQSLPLA